MSFPSQVVIIEFLLITEDILALVVVNTEALGFDRQDIIGSIDGFQTDGLPRQGQAAIVVIGIWAGRIAFIRHDQQGLGLKAQGNQAAFRPVSGVGPGH